MLLDQARARKLLEDRGVDALVAHSPENFFYATTLRTQATFILRSIRGFAVLFSDKNKAPALVITHDAAEYSREFCWIEDQRYTDFEVYVERKAPPKIAAGDTIGALSKALTEKGIAKGRIALEMDSIPLAAYERIRKHLPDASIVDGSGIFQELRETKSVEEVARIRKATEITDKATDRTLEHVRTGVTELELKQVFEKAVLEEGGDLYFLPHVIIGAGKNGAFLSHHVPSSYKCQAGDLILFDLGAVYDGYTTDIAREACVQKVSANDERLYNVLQGAVEDVIASIRPGARPCDLFRQGQDTIRKAGYQDYRRGMIGHGVGITVHEGPSISPSNTKPLQAANVLTVETPYYISGHGGLNYEDIVLVTENDHEILSRAKKGLHIS